jgi:hypothetical protein
MIGSFDIRKNREKQLKLAFGNGPGRFLFPNGLVNNVFVPQIYVEPKK